MKKWMLLSRSMLVLSFVLAAGCDKKSTFVLARFERGAQLVGDVAQIDLFLQLGTGTNQVGQVDQATVRNKDGSALSFPFTRALQIVKGTGRLQVLAKAKNPAGTELGSTSGEVDVTRGEITGLTLIFGSSVSSDLDAEAPDLAPALAAPVIVVTPPAGPVYELGSDGKSSYIWTITASQDGAALPPLLTFDNATLQPGMIPSSTSANAATLSFRPSFRQAGSYSVKVNAVSTVLGGSESTSTFLINVLNTVDPIGNFYTKEDTDLLGTPKSLGVQGVGDFNSDGYDDVVHITRSRRVLGTPGTDVETTVHFYVLLGGPTGLPLPPGDSTSLIALPHPRIRRIDVTRTRSLSGTKADNSHEALPSAFDDFGDPIASSPLFAESASDNGTEIFFTDFSYLLKDKAVQALAQVFVAPSNAPDESIAVPLLDEGSLMPGYGCPGAVDCEYPLLARGDVNGDGKDDLMVYTYLFSAGAAAPVKTRQIRYVSAVNGAPTLPILKNLDTGGQFSACTAIDASKTSFALGIGKVLPGPGADFGIFGCTKEAENAVAYLFSDGAAGFPTLEPGFAVEGRQAFFTSPKDGTDGTAGFQKGFCDVNDDGLDDLYQLNTSIVPNEVQVYLNQAPTLVSITFGANAGYVGDAFPVLGTGELDVSKQKKVVLANSEPSFGPWQWHKCVRGAGKSKLFVMRADDGENERYDVIEIATNVAGDLVGQVPWTQGQMIWPGDTTTRQWFNRPKSGGDFNGDGKLDVISTAMAPGGQSYWNVLYGR